MRIGVLQHAFDINKETRRQDDGNGENLPHRHFNENPNADLPDVQVQYWEDD